ncbi:MULTISPECIES: hypothetical protein [Aeromonas]
MLGQHGNHIHNSCSHNNEEFDAFTEQMADMILDIKGEMMEQAENFKKYQSVEVR